MLRVIGIGFFIIFINELEQDWRAVTPFAEPTLSSKKSRASKGFS